MRPTMHLKFISGKLHQLFLSDDAMTHEWRLVPSE
jgi:hypothetical protein